MKKKPSAFRRRKIGKAGIGVGITTAVFVVVGTIFIIIGYKDDILSWMKETGVALLVVSLFPLAVLAYNLFLRKIGE